jgi:hypothetical protein
MRIEGGCREECRPEDTRNEGNPFPEVGCRPRGDEAADENGNRRGSKHPGDSYPHVLSSVLSRLTSQAVRIGWILSTGAALGVVAAGWIALFLSAGLAMGSGTNTAIAIALALAGTAALLGLLVGSLGLLRARAWIGQTASVLLVGVSAVLGLVAFVFVFSLHW